MSSSERGEPLRSMVQSPKYVVELAFASKDKRISVILREKLAYEQSPTSLMESL